MNRTNAFLVTLVTLMTISCAHTSAVVLDETLRLSPSQSVLILEKAPIEPYIVLARLETRGFENQPIPDLLVSMREKAKELGADAIIPIDERQEAQQQGVMYNPLLSGYQTVGGGNQPVLTGYAILFENSIRQRTASYAKPQIVHGGFVLNTIPLPMGGIGLSVWTGKNRYRITLDYLSMDIPQALFRDGFTKGRVENSIRVSSDLFFSTS